MVIKLRESRRTTSRKLREAKRVFRIPDGLKDELTKVMESTGLSVDINENDMLIPDYGPGGQPTGYEIHHLWSVDNEDGEWIQISEEDGRLVVYSEFYSDYSLDDQVKEICQKYNIDYEG